MPATASRAEPLAAAAGKAAAVDCLDGLVFPETIRVGITGSTTCDPHAPYTVKEIDFKDYVRHVLPIEWFPLHPGEELHPDAVRAGAVAAKMYAWFWISRGGKWEGADVLDSTCDQVYDPQLTRTVTDQAIEDTWDWVLTRDGELFQTSYKHDNILEECTPGICMNVVEAQFFALDGVPWHEILLRFYAGAELSVYAPPEIDEQSLGDTPGAEHEKTPTAMQVAAGPANLGEGAARAGETSPLPMETVIEHTALPTAAPGEHLPVGVTASQPDERANLARKVALWGGGLGAVGLTSGLAILFTAYCLKRTQQLLRKNRPQ